MWNIKKNFEKKLKKKTKNCSKIAKKSLFFNNFGNFSFLNQTLGLRKSFLNRDSFLNRAFLNQDSTVYIADMTYVNVLPEINLHSIKLEESTRTIMLFEA